MEEINSLIEKDDNPDLGPEASEVIKSFDGPKLEYVGTGTADFQAQPLILGQNGQPIILSDWEMHAKHEVDTDKQHPENFPHFLEEYELYIKRAEELGLNMFRFSLDFARLCPSENEFNEKMMGEYVRALATVKSHGMEPVLCIYHWPMPKYLLDIDNKGHIKAGGWENPKVQEHFKFYVENVVSYLGNDKKISSALSEVGFSPEDQDKIVEEGLVQYFLTINEPTSILGPGYLLGTFPPYKKGNILGAISVLEQLATAHNNAMEELSELGKRKGAKVPQVAATHNWALIEGLPNFGNKLDFNKLVSEVSNYYVTRFMEDTSQSDFMALQYYHRLKFPLVHGSSDQRIYGDMPDFGDIYMPGISKVLMEMHDQYPNKPIMVTEFGFSDKSDLLRPYWLLETTRYALETKKMGVPLRGMLQWSLVNNYEWAHGMDVPFGLFNEEQLSQPLISSQENSVTSWEVLKSIASVLLPQDEKSQQDNLKELDRIYKIAYEQFTNEVERRQKK